MVAVAGSRAFAGSGAAALSIAAIACVVPPEVAVIDPSMPDEVAWIAVLELEDGALVRASGLLARAPGQAVLEALADPRDRTVIAIGFSDPQVRPLSPPDAASLLDAPLALAAEGEPRFPAPLWRASFQIEAGEAISGGAVDPPALTASWLPRVSMDACASFTHETFTPEEGLVYDAFFAVALDATSALVGTRPANGVTGEPRLFRVTRTKETRSVRSDVKVSGAFRDEPGELWLAGAAGEIFRGRLEGDGLVTERVATSTAGQAFLWIDGSRTASGALELFLLSPDGAFERFDGRSLTHLADLESRGGPLSGFGGVRRLGPRHAVAALGSSPILIRWRDGVISEEVVATEEPTAALASTQGLGLVAATVNGSFYREERLGTWSLIGSTPPIQGRPFAPRVLAAFDGGLVFGSEGGYVGQLHAPSGILCPVSRLGTGTIEDITAVGDALLLTGCAPGGGSALTFTFLHRTR